MEAKLLGLIPAFDLRTREQESSMLCKWRRVGYIGESSIVITPATDVGAAFVSYRLSYKETNGG